MGFNRAFNSCFLFVCLFVFVNWLMESLSQVFLFYLWNVHLVKLKLFHNESRATSVVQVNKMLPAVS